MLNQPNSYSFKPSYSKSKNYPTTNLNITTYQESPSKMLQETTSKISYYDPTTTRSKELNSPYKTRCNAENETPGEKQISLKSRFEDLKKRYQYKDKPQNFSFQKSSPLKETQQNKLEISFNKNSQKKSIGYLNISSSQKKNNLVPSTKEKVSEFNNPSQDRIPLSNNNYFKNKPYTIIQTTNKLVLTNQNQTRPSFQSTTKIEEERTEEIDKITQKIQKIMKCINDNQKSTDEKANMKKFIPPTFVAPKYTVPANRRTSVAQIELSEKDKIKNQFKEKVSEFTATPSITQLKVPSTANKIQKKPVVEAINNRNSNSVPAKSAGTTQRTEFTLSNGKDIDQQIKKIHDRIRKSEEQKRKLNIKFQDFKEYPTRNKTIQMKPAKIQKFDDKSIEKMRSDTKKNIKQDLKREQITPTKISNFLIEKSEAKINKKLLDQKESKISKLQMPSYTNLSKRSFPETKSSNGSYNQSSTNTSKIQINRLTEFLKQQANLDQSLRDGKLIFSMSDDIQKWKKLKVQIEKCGKINLSESEIKSEFQITLEQHDPFFSIREKTQNESVQALAKKYTEAYNYFNNNIKHKFNSQKLAKQNFKQQTLDLQRKGYLTVEDFVRYLNMQTGTFYRNRDLVLIFRRFTTGSELKFRDFLKVLCQ